MVALRVAKGLLVLGERRNNDLRGRERRWFPQIVLPLESSFRFVTPV
jgi:hypothetical protein